MGFNSGFTRLNVTTAAGGSTDLTAVASNITPTTDNLYDIGTQALSWDEIYVDSIKVGTGSLTSLAITFGDGENEGIYSDPTNEEVIIAAAGTAVLAVSSSAVQPFANNTIDLGTSAEKWKDLYVDGIGYIDQLGNATTRPTSNHLGATTWYGNLIASVGSTHDIGADGTTFANLYLDTLYMRDLKETNFDLTVTEAATSYVSCSFNSGSVGHLQASGSFDFKFIDIPTDSSRTAAMTLYVSQSSTTPGSITWDPVVIWGSGSPPTLTNASGSIDVFTFFTSGSARVVGFTGAQNMS